eukprot:365011-Chlamydomonas_euryale.AAC.29
MRRPLHSLPLYSSGLAATDHHSAIDSPIWESLPSRPDEAVTLAPPSAQACQVSPRATSCLGGQSELRLRLHGRGAGGQGRKHGHPRSS